MVIPLLFIILLGNGVPYGLFLGFCAGVDSGYGNKKLSRFWYGFTVLSCINILCNMTSLALLVWATVMFDHAVSVVPLDSFLNVATLVRRMLLF